MALTTKLEFTEDMAFHTYEGEAFIEIGDDTIDLMGTDLDELQEFINIARENTHEEEDPLTFASGGFVSNKSYLTLGPESLKFLNRALNVHIQTDGRDCE